jgi:hypothetical protein
MDRLKAQELLDDPEHCWRLNQEGLETLLIRAGYKRSVAHKVALDHGWQRLCSGKEV